jgi:NitT/TauT family transport system substrate-binding protein
MLPIRPLFLPQLLLLFLAWPAASAGAAEPLVIVESGQPVYALLYIAAANGYFRDAGLEVRLRRTESAAAALRAALDGRAQLAALPTPLVTQRILMGDRLGIVSILHASGRSMAVLASTAEGVAGPKDLDGKRVGFDGGVGTEFFLEMLLVSAGVGPGAVEYVELGDGCEPSALEQGRVAAVAVSSACAHLLRDRLDAETNIFFSDVYTDIAVLAGLRELVNARAEAISPLLRALAQAERFLYEEPERALQTVAAALPELGVEALRAAWPTLSPRLGLSNVLLEQLQQESEWLAARRLSGEAAPDFRLLLMPRFLKQADPERVTAY